MFFAVFVRVAGAGGPRHRDVTARCIFDTRILGKFGVRQSRRCVSEIRSGADFELFSGGKGE